MKFIRVLKASLPVFDKSGYYDLTNESDFKPIIDKFMNKIKSTFIESVADDAKIDENQFNQFKNSFQLKLDISKYDKTNNKFEFITIKARGNYNIGEWNEQGIAGEIYYNTPYAQTVNSGNERCSTRASRYTKSSGWGPNASDVTLSFTYNNTKICNNNFTKLNENNLKKLVENLFNDMYEASVEWCTKQKGQAAGTKVHYDMGDRS